MHESVYQSVCESVCAHTDSHTPHTHIRMRMYTNEHPKEWEAESGKEIKVQEKEINDSLLCHTPIINKESIDKPIIGKDYKLIKIINFHWSNSFISCAYIILYMQSSIYIYIYL
jgi:hypothetical protein